MSTLTIITGASRGLGLALAYESIQNKSDVITLERTPSATLARHASKCKVRLIQLQTDLSDIKSATAVLHQELSQVNPHDYDSVYLINNAGVLGPVGDIAKNPELAITNAIAVNFTAPILLTRTFLKVTRKWTVEKRVMNISSGAARKNVPGWAIYCSTKAALDRFSSVVNEDEKAVALGAKIVAIAPGVIDTDMQSQIRGSSVGDFPQLQRFIDLKAHNSLCSASETADKLLCYLNSPSFGQDSLTDIRTLTFSK